MTRRRCSLGLDLGTSGLKALLLADDGEVLAHATSTYDLSTPQPGWAETDPADWERAAREAVASLLEAVPDAEIVSIAIDGQMHGAVLVDAAGEALRPAVLWPDARAASALGPWRDLPPAHARDLANPVTPGMAGPIVGWLARHEAPLVASARMMLAPKDWLRTRLVPGSLVTDASDASASLLWNARGNGWDLEVAGAAGIRADLLAPVVSSSEVAGVLDRAVAEAWGLPEGIPVAVGCADVPATILGMPASPDRYTVIVGTGAQVILPQITSSYDGPIAFHTYRAADDSSYAMAAVMNAGLALQRVVTLLGATWAELYESSAGPVPSEAPGFLPFFTGERLPVAIPAMSGGWFDLGLATDRRLMLRSALEAVAFSIRRSMAAMPPARELTIDVVGGGTREAGFSQLIADVVGVPLRRLSRENATAVGAAQLGWIARDGRPVELPSSADGEIVPRPSAALEERYRRFDDRVAALVGGQHG